MIPVYSMEELALLDQDYSDGPIDFYSEPDKFGATRRDPSWERVSKAWLKVHPFCAACGTSVHVEVHHKKPFHLFPELELIESNWIGLCRPRGCHLWIGHSGSWAHYNPHVIEDAAQFLRRIRERLPL